jgi:hypothetical protein
MVEDPGQRYLDGDAVYLDKGTALHVVKGYRPTFRLAARRDGELVLFEAAENPRARTWADLLDLGSKVRWIGVNDGSNRPLAALRDRQHGLDWTCPARRWWRRPWRADLTAAGAPARRDSAGCPPTTWPDPWRTWSTSSTSDRSCAATAQP